MKNFTSLSNSTGSILRIFFFFACILLPATGLYFAFNFFAENNQTHLKNQASSRLNNFAAEILVASNHKQFWLKNLTDIFLALNSVEELDLQLKKIMQMTSVHADFMVFDKQGNHLHDNLKDSAIAASWKKTGPALMAIMSSNSNREAFKNSKNLADVFGPDFYFSLREATKRSVADDFYNSDILSPQFIYWGASSAKMTLLIRLPASELQKKTGLRLLFNDNRNNGLTKTIFTNDRLVYSEIPERDAKTAFRHFSTDLSTDLIEQDNRLLKIVQFDRKSCAIIGVTMPDKLLKPGQLTILTAMIILMLLISMIRSGFLPAKPEDMPLIAQIFILMAITAGIPLGALGLIGLRHFNNRETTLINENFNQMREYVEFIRTQVQVEHARAARMLRQAVEINKATLSSNFNSKNTGRDFCKSINKLSVQGYLVKENQYINLQNSNTEANADKKGADNDSSIKLSEVERTNAILFGSYFLSALNGTKKPELSLEKAYMFEMFFQKPLPMFIQELLSSEGTIIAKGWGSEKLLMFNQAFKLAAEDFFNLYVFCTYAPVSLEMRFFKNHMHSIQQNRFGYKVFVADRLTLVNENDLLKKFPEENQLFNQTSSSQQTEPRIVAFYHEPHLFFGQAGRRDEKELRFCAVFPMAKIAELINKEAKELLIVALSAASIVGIMIVVLYMNLLVPVKQLHLAAQALESRNTQFRLKAKHQDEFGEMAEIFNQSIAELDELNIASLVQARLLPSSSLIIGNYSLYGKSLPMADLGGDYFDFFTVDNNNIAMMLGDVAGHGVGAALIMAIAKAGIIVAANDATNPALILSKLHQIILATRTKQQRKVMTFQYLLLNQATRQILYANAGGCSPALVNSLNGTVTEISHGGGVLGGFKKNNITNLELAIEPGQAIIFYTDGIVESRNGSGNELGYAGLYELFLNCYENDAEKYYLRIMDSYRKWLGNNKAGDDLTILILACGQNIAINQNF